MYRQADSGKCCLTCRLLFQVSKAARQEKKFQDYNSRCTFHHQAKVPHSFFLFTSIFVTHLARE